MSSKIDDLAKFNIWIQVFNGISQSGLPLQKAYNKFNFSFNPSILTSFLILFLFENFIKSMGTSNWTKEFPKGGRPVTRN